MRNFFKKGKNVSRRLLALALGVLCLASLCPAEVFAARPGQGAGTGDNNNINIQLEFVPKLSDADGTEDYVRMLYGNQVGVFVENGDQYAPGSDQGAWVFRKLSSSDAAGSGLADVEFKPEVTSGSGLKNFTLQVSRAVKKDDTDPAKEEDHELKKTDVLAQTFSFEANFVTVKEGYGGDVVAGGQQGGATLLKGLAIYGDSSIELVCTQNEYSGNPTFEIKKGTTPSGIFAGFLPDNAQVAVIGSASQNLHNTRDPMASPKIVCVEVSLKDQDTDKTLTPIRFSFEQVLTNADLKDDDGNPLKRDEKGNFVPLTSEDEKLDDAAKAQLSKITNNYFRGVTNDANALSYRITFRKPRSRQLTLEIATPLHAINTIVTDIEGDFQLNNSERKFVKFEGAGEAMDRPEQISKDAFTLTTKDRRYDAEFGINWNWIPLTTLEAGESKTEDDWKKEIKALLAAQGRKPTDEDAAAIYASLTQEVKSTYKIAGYTGSDSDLKDYVYLPPSQNGSSVTATVKHDRSENITGLIAGRVSYTRNKTVEAIKAYSFPITVRGQGTPASVEFFGTRTGEEPGTEHKEGTETVANEDGVPRFTLFSEKNKVFPERTTTYPMDVFDGGVQNYTVSNLKPFEYVLQLNMGLNNGKAEYAMVTVENNGGDAGPIVELKERTPANRLPQGMGEQEVTSLDDATKEIPAIKAILDSGKNPTVNDLLDVGKRPKENTNSWLAQKNETDRTFTQIDNPLREGNDDATQGVSYLVVRALRAQTEEERKNPVKITVTYYVDIHDNGTPEPVGSHSIQFNVDDSSPSKDNTLNRVILEGVDGKTVEEMEIGFAPETNGYTVNLPYTYQNYRFRVPIKENQGKTSQPIRITATTPRGGVLNWWKDKDGNPTNETTMTMQQLSGTGLEFTIWDTLEEAEAAKSAFQTKINEQYVLTFHVQAEDTRDPAREYTFTVKREDASTDKTLSLLGVYAETDTEGTNNLITGFDPKSDYYVVQIPYSTQYLRIATRPTDDRAAVTYQPVLVKLSGQGKPEFLAMKEKLALEHGSTKLEDAAVPGYGSVQLPCLRIFVDSESELAAAKKSGTAIDHSKDPAENATYRVFFERTPASTDATVRAITVADAKDTAATPAALPYTPNFSSTNVGPYRMTEANALSYTTDTIRFKVTPNSPLVSKIEIQQDGKTLATIDNPDAFSEEIALKAKSKDFTANVFDIVVTAEDEKTSKTYQFEIERDQPKEDADLLDVVVAGDDEKAITSFKFHRDETEYKLVVPYETRKVSFLPTLSDKNAMIRLRDDGNVLHQVSSSVLDMLDKLTPGQTSKLYELNDWGKPRKFELIVSAENRDVTKTYTFTIEREAPSTDALLKRLEVSGLTEDGLSPLFKAKEKDYSATMAEGAPSITVTPTANEPHATIMIDGQVVASGAASEPIEVIDEHQTVEIVDHLDRLAVIDEHQTVEIVVTAQDGTTKQTYTIDVFNQNLVEKTNNADLQQLKIQNGLMTPNFKAAVTEYEVAVKEDTWSVDILPVTADELATFKVMNGTREIGDYNGNYALALVDGENNISVEVTSPDKTQKKVYTVKIYRNKEEELKNLTPLTAEDIDFEHSPNPIIVSLVEYPRISADVFTELRDKYPEKSIVFEGRDYSMVFQASTLNTLIPTREIYDFRMDFNSPDSAAIYSLVEKWEQNDDILDIVLLHFDYHGDLPGPAILNVTLSNRYGNQPLFWHYYQQERQRIDYYGSVRSNAAGSFSVAIDHCSTYVVSRVHPIYGAENQDGTITAILQRIAGGGGSNNSSSGKPNPSTAAGEGAA